jgi:hypothetical protein
VIGDINQCGSREGCLLAILNGFIRMTLAADCAKVDLRGIVRSGHAIGRSNKNENEIGEGFPRAA